jgi:hypothetical protein
MTNVRYYFSVNTTTAIVVTDPPTGAAAPFSTMSVANVVTVLNDTFETNQGWSGVAPGDTATTGRWNRMDPQQTLAQPGDDVTPAPGVICWVTDGNAGIAVGDFDVDGGHTTLTSPLLSLAGEPEARVSYWRWYSNSAGASAFSDTFVISVTNDDGANWTVVETIGPSGAQVSGGWFFNEFRVGDFITPTNQVRVRFVASDIGSGSIVEAAVDDFKALVFQCDTGCYADCDESGSLTIADFGCFQGKFAGGDPYADCNQSGSLTIADFACFQTEFAQGCP